MTGNQTALVQPIEMTRLEPDIIVVHLPYHDTAAAESHELESVIDDLLGSGEKKVIVDLAGVKKMDSTCAGAMTQCFLLARSAGAKLRFAAASSHVARMLRITQLDTFLPIDTTVELARERLAAARAA